MGGCASRPKESDMNNEEGSATKKHVSENVVAKENNTENGENETKTETTETSVEAKETSEVEQTKEITPAAEPEVAVVEESSSAGEAVAAPEKEENVTAPTENVEAAVDAVAVAEPEKVEVAAEAEATKAVEAEPVKAEAEPVKEEKEATVTV